jgi:hypothetical protein
MAELLGVDGLIEGDEAFAELGDVLERRRHR